MKRRTILVTGAASGLGRGIATHLASRGHRLMLTDRDRDGLRETAEQLGAGESCAGTWCFDVASSAEIDRFMKSLPDEPIDVLINNAGLQHVSPVETFPEDRWDLLLDVMLKGPFLLSKAVLPRMRQFGYGRIVNIGSIHTLVASPYKGAYVAAKHGLHGLAKVICLETGDSDITVNTICPAYVQTPLVDAQIAAQAKANGLTEAEVIEKVFLDPMPKKAFITAEEVGATIEFLMSHEARNITGQAIAIDGGWTAR
jgi:3-hydroxybutyrate dehydrogenase